MRKSFISTVLLLLVLSGVTYGQTEIAIPPKEKASLDSLRQLEGKYWTTGEVVKNTFVRHEVFSKYSNYLSERDKATWATKVGESYHSLGSYFLAIDFWNKSLTYENPELKSYTLARIGSAYIELGKLDSARVFYTRAVSNSTKDSERIPHLNSLGFVNFLNENYSAALVRYNQALELLSNSEEVDSTQYYVVLSNLASLSIATGDKVRGVKLLKKIKNSRWYQNEGWWFHVEILTKLARFNLAEGNCDQTIRYLDELEGVYEDASPDKGYLSFLELKLEQLQLCGSIADLRSFQKEYVRVEKDVRAQDREHLLIVEKLQRSIYEDRLGLAESNLQLKEDSKQILELSNTRLKRLFWISGIFFISIIAFVIFWFSQKRSKQRRVESYLQLKEELLSEQEKISKLEIKMAQQEIDNKKLEMSQILNSINRNSALIVELQERLTSLKNKEGDVKEDIAQLLHFLKSHGHSNDINKLIEENFDELGGKFKEKVEALYPDLTPSEMQLLILMKIGLSTKEMALMKNVEPSSIRIFKHRLKAKMNLEKNQDLVSYISSI